ncbi:MAG TPA: hypothetical protein DCP28_15500 [Cytophagales bacterium]|nr:hypothetical protein [Cytophagales bacterium]
MTLDASLYSDGDAVLLTHPHYGGIGHLVHEIHHAVTSVRGMKVKITGPDAQNPLTDWYWLRDDTQVYIEYFEVEEGRNDVLNAESIQEAIDYVSWSQEEFVHARAGVYSVKGPIYLFDNAKALNYGDTPPTGYANNFNPNREGRIGIIGEGCTGVTDTRDAKFTYGTVFRFTNTESHSLFCSVIQPNYQVDSNGNIVLDGQGNPTLIGDKYKYQLFTLKDFTVEHISESGYGIYIETGASSLIENVSVRVTSTKGSGVRFTSSWFGVVRRLISITARNPWNSNFIPEAGSIGLLVGSTQGGGTFSVSDSVIEGFHNNVSDDQIDHFHLQVLNEPSPINYLNHFHPMVFESTAFQGSESDNLVFTGEVDLTLSNCFWERSYGSSLVMTNKNANLFMYRGYFSLAYAVQEPDPENENETITVFYGYTKDPIIDLTDVGMYTIQEMKVRRPFSTFVRVRQSADNEFAPVGEVKHVSFIAWENAKFITNGPIFMFEAEALPPIPPSTDPLRLPPLPTLTDLRASGFDSSTIEVYDKSKDLYAGAEVGVTVAARAGYGEITRITSDQAIWWDGQRPKKPGFLVLSSTVNNSLYLTDPADEVPGRSAVICVVTTSTGLWNVRDHNQAIVQTINPGGAYRIIADPGAGTWIVEQLTITV